MRKAMLSIITFALLASATTLWAFDPDTGDELQLSVAKAILDVKKADPGIEKFFDGAAGYAARRGGAK